jgi:hypothetical protein
VRADARVDDPAALGLESGRLPGGRYLRTRLRGEPRQLDESSPSIEFYRRHDEIDLLLPVAAT